MLCEKCGVAPATIHLTTIVGGEKIEQHLCAACCQKQKQALTMAGMSTLLLSLLKGASGVPDETVTLRCHSCGQTFEVFQKTGMLGCPKCYEVFKEHLTPLLSRIHGKTSHTGRVPPDTFEQTTMARRLESLRRNMDRAIAEEDFELAAQLRDEIRAMQPAKEPSSDELDSIDNVAVACPDDVTCGEVSADA
ncbi:MAG: UvrB/UvrC motif-containing protein [Oscillospiraceae bacterium]|jgi:protein arginine kinase activator|nr:UvrB/UvrC motif-containing protein [Oscillospiraceae bacterium]